MLRYDVIFLVIIVAIITTTVDTQTIDVLPI